MEITTSRLRLRPWRHEEAARVLEVYGELEVVRWLGDGEPVLMPDLDAAHRAVDRFAERSRTPPLGFWAIEVRETGTVAGTVALAQLPLAERSLPEGETTREVEIAWLLHPDSWGHGYATEAARAILEYGFAGGLPRIYAVTHLGNVRSQAVCSRVGLHHLGREQPWYGVPMEVYVTPAPG